MASAVSQPQIATPFTSSPDPTGVFLTTSFRSAIRKTNYAIEHRQGLATVLGDPGHGKSTLLRYLYARFSSLPGYLCSFTPNPNFKSDYGLLKKIGVDLGVEPRRSMLVQQSHFEDWLTDQYLSKSNVVVFIDEAQRLDGAQLELIRTLLNFESDTEKAIQVVLAGNLDLRDRLIQKKHKAIMSRIFAPSLIPAMDYEEMLGMLRIRCEREALGWPFSDEAMRLVFDWSGGTPRAILQACEFAYADAVEWADGHNQPRLVTAAMMSAVISDLLIREDAQAVRVRK